MQKRLVPLPQAIAEMQEIYQLQSFSLKSGGSKPHVGLPNPEHQIWEVVPK